MGCKLEKKLILKKIYENWVFLSPLISETTELNFFEVRNIELHLSFKYRKTKILTFNFPRETKNFCEV